MWTYIIRRLLVMIPTLFGVTIVSFIVMQIAPGDPLKVELGSGGTQTQGATRESYLLQRRELKLDKPWFLNFNYFKDYDETIESASYFFGRTEKQVAEELMNLSSQLASGSPDATIRKRHKFLKSLNITDFSKRLAQSAPNPDMDPVEQEALRRSLAKAVKGYIKILCEDLTKHAIPAAINLLKSDVDLPIKIGAIKCLQHLSDDAIVYTYKGTASEDQTARILSTWQSWWEKNKDTFDELDSEREEELSNQIEGMLKDPDYRNRLFDQLLERAYFKGDIPYFMKLLHGESSLTERDIASVILFDLVYRMRGRKDPLAMDIKESDKAATVDEVAHNWITLFYEPQMAKFHPSTGAKFAAIVADTQYAHMVLRLITFDFGKSVKKTRDPVGKMLWEAFIVSAPLMVMAQLVIYFVAVPLGITCAVHRGTWIDRLISLMLFLLYSIPPFVAAMLFLLFFCYGVYFEWFPKDRLHSPEANEMSFIKYWLDYLWHCFLPVVCLSLFSLAGLAMYSRSAMLDVLGKDFIRTAYAKGLGRGTVIYKHALRNGLIPILTLFSNFLPALLGGSVLIEVLFDIPGLGRLGWASITGKDLPVLMALLYVSALVVMFSILVTDILYVIVDPRISFESQDKK